MNEGNRDKNIFSPSRIEISRENLLHNFNEFRHRLSAGNKIAAVVKANAYGHGVREVVKILDSLPQSERPDFYQVDDLAELQEIRQFTDAPVLLFGFVGMSDVALSEIVRLDAALGVYDLNSAEILNNVALAQNKKVNVHVKIDALLGRQGILPDRKNLSDFFLALKKMSNLNVEAIYSHFSNIEDVEDLKHAQDQHKVLLEVKEVVRSAGYEKIFHHISATSGFLTDQKNNWGGQILRLGIGLYGLWPSESLRERYSSDLSLRPVMRWVTQIAQVKELPVDFPIGYGCTFVTKSPIRIAVIPQGYSDGYDRGFSNNSEVLIAGQRCPVLGRVAMNMFVVDVTDVEESRAVAGGEVILLGSQNCRGRAEEISAEELANRIDTINYEVVTRVWPKIPRVVV